MRHAKAAGIDAFALNIGIDGESSFPSNMVLLHTVLERQKEAWDWKKCRELFPSSNSRKQYLTLNRSGFTNTQLEFAYESAYSNGMSVFLSFDFNWYSTSNTSGIAGTIGTYAGHPAQLKLGSKVFVSSFAGDGLNLAAVESDLADHTIFWAPNFQPPNIATADALFNWMAWPNNGDNKAPDAGSNLTVADGDTSYIAALAGKPYVARKLPSPY